MTNMTLDNVQTGVAFKPPKIVVYGVGGVGKTTFCAAAPNPIFLFTEEGQGNLDVARFPLAKSWADVLAAVGTLYTEDHDYQTLVIDSIDFAEPLLWDHTAQAGGKENIEDFGYGKGYGFAVDGARELLSGLDALRDEKGMAIILIAHSDVVRFENPEGEAYDTFDLRLHKRLRETVDYWCDAVLFANFKQAVVKDKEGFNKERARAVGSGERVLYTERRPAFRAKNRYSLPPQMPLEWDAFANAVSTSQSNKETTDA